MSDLDERLPVIQRLRTERNALGQEVYALRTEIARTTAALHKSRQAGGRRVAPDTAAIAAAREEIANQESRLRQLAERERQARATVARHDDARRRTAHLARSLAGQRSALARLEEYLQRISGERPLNHSLIADLESSIKTASGQIMDAERSLETTSEAESILAEQARQAVEELRDVGAEREPVRQVIDRMQAEIGALRDASGPTTQDLEKRLEMLNDRYVDRKGTWRGRGVTLQDRIKAIYVDPHPRPVVAQMRDTSPFLLLPVRIETRFVSLPQRPGAPAVRELWVRIYPDDVAVHTHESELTDREVAAGESYWRSIFAIEKDTAGDKATRKTDAWRQFAVLFGPSRSAWVARQTRPTNWSSLAGIAAADELVFPTHDLTKTSAWSRAPRTHVLPDRFVVMAYIGDSVAHEIVGSVVPDELFVGPEPLDLTSESDEAEVDGSFVTVDGQLTFGTDFDWASNFERAVALGMGVKIPLTVDQAERGFDKILVLGVMASASPATGKGMLEELLANHHHSPKGLTLVRQGTATNNTDDVGSGYSINDTIEQTREVTGLDVPLFNEHSLSDGRLLADALGVRHETLHHVFNSDAADYREAVAMNRALYPATLGYYLDTLLPALSESDRDRLRAFFVDYVTGRGPISPIRVGDQPYGILLTSDFTKWKATVGRRPAPDRFPEVLLAVLRHFDAIWQSLLPQLAYAGKPGLSSAEALVNVLGLQPGSVTVAQRVGYSTELLRNMADFQVGGREFDEVIGAWIEELYVKALLRGFGWQQPTGDADRGLPLLRLIYQHYTTPLDAANLVDAVPLSESERVREYDTATHANYLHWLRDATSVAVLSAQNFGGAPVPTALLYLQLRHALILQLHKTAVNWVRRFDIDATVTASARTFHNVRPAGTLSRWEMLKAPVSAIDSNFADRTRVVGDYLLQPPFDLGETAFLEEMREALADLADLPTARLERCFIEHVDSCTYRLDAWQTAMFKGRLDALRASQSDDKERRGTFLGAFGWVEDVRPSASSLAVNDVPEKLRSPKDVPLREYADNGGFVHAPSINHATAAALLRAGYMSHATPENPDLLSVNISSERVRRALFIFQGMRHGQSVEALLGYQFERGIHDRASADASLGVLNGFIVDIRIAFPITRVRLGAGASGGAEETVEAYDVVNGLSLAEAASPDWAAITGADSTVLTPARIAALNQERDKLADTLDALKDLLISESAYQLVQGNFDRAGAVLGSVRDAHVPPDLDVIKTPRSSRFGFTHRVSIHFDRLDPLDPTSAGWAAVPMTPRATLEPGVNRWLANVLDAPENIQFSVFEVMEDESLVNPAVLTAADLELQPIDLVYIIGADANTGAEGRTGASELESRVAWRYRLDNGLDETSRIQIQFGAPRNQPGKLTMAELMPLMRSLQTILSESRALGARDYLPSTTQGGTPGSGFDFTDLRVRAERLQAQLADALAAVHAVPFYADIGSTAVETLGQAFEEMRVQEVDVESLYFAFSAADAMALQETLIRLAAFGIADALPRSVNVVPDSGKFALIRQAMDASAAAATRRAASSKLLADAVAAAETPDKAIALAADACKAILGQAFTVLPVYALANEADVTQSNADHAQLVDHAVTALGMVLPEDEWIRSVAHVRPKIAAWERIRLLQETLFGRTLGITALQLPFRGRDSWLALPFPATDPATGKPFDITRDTLSMVVHGAGAFIPGSLRCGILVDAWTEKIPARDQSTGITFHYNRPNAMPPQALLLVVPPELTGQWSWDALVGILNDTLRRAKLRAVEPLILDKKPGSPELSVLLPAIISEFQQYDLNVSLDMRLNLVAMAPLLTLHYMNPNLSA